MEPIRNPGGDVVTPRYFRYLTTRVRKDVRLKKTSKAGRDGQRPKGTLII